MRTLTSTFTTKDEAEAAARRLETIGIASERILLKEVASPPGAPPGAGAALFMSVKVPTHQVAAVNQIMKGDWSDEEEETSPPVAASTPAPGPAAASSALDFDGPARPLPSPARQPAPARPESGTAAASNPDRDRLRRYALFYLVALIAAFLIGAGLGLIG